MPNELELCTISALIGALLGGAVAYTVTHKIDRAALETERAAHASDIARINATTAQQLADAIAKGQAAQGKVATIQQQFDNEVAKHAKDSLNYRAQLLAGTQRVRVHTTGCSASSTGSQGTGTASRNDDTAPSADLSPTVAAGVFAVVDDADHTADKLRALQQYVKELQNDGYISK